MQNYWQNDVVSKHTPFRPKHRQVSSSHAISENILLLSNHSFSILRQSKIFYRKSFLKFKPKILLSAKFCSIRGFHLFSALFFEIFEKIPFLPNDIAEEYLHDSVSSSNFPSTLGISKYYYFCLHSKHRTSLRLSS